MVYESIYFYGQNLAMDMGKVGKKTCHLPKPKKVSGVCTLKVRADSKRTFYALSNRYMNRYTFMVKIWLWIWAKLVKKPVICPNLKKFLASAH
jgi:hypothetical protein